MGAGGCPSLLPFQSWTWVNKPSKVLFLGISWGFLAWVCLSLSGKPTERTSAPAHRGPLTKATPISCFFETPRLPGAGERAGASRLRELGQWPLRLSTFAGVSSESNVHLFFFGGLYGEELEHDM